MTETRLDKLQRLAEQKPDDPFPLYGLAMERKRLGELDEAVATFQRLVEDFPDYTAAYYHYGSCLISVGREEEAGSILEKGIETATRSGNAHARDELQDLLAEIQR